MNILMRQPEMIGLLGVEPARFTLAKVDPAERDFVALRQDDRRAEGRGTPD